MNIGERIKTKRIEQGMTQKEVADKVFVTRQTISKWELGKSSPDLVSLKLLSELLKEDFLKNEKQNEEEMNMKITLKDIIMTILFGIFFLPIRMAVSWLIPRINRPLLKYAAAPITGLLFILYIKSLTEQGFVVVAVLSFCLYYLVVSYFSDSHKEVSN